MWEWIAQYWTEVFFSLVVTGLGWGYRYLAKHIKAQKTEQEAILQGIRAYLRDRIIQGYKYHMGQGYCPIYEQDNIQELYKAYKDLKGNGVISRLIDDLYKLPTEKRSDETR